VLQGSTQGRYASAKEKNQPVPILKDNDFVSRDVRIQIGPEKAESFKEQLRRDCEVRADNVVFLNLLVETASGRGINHSQPLLRGTIDTGI
jgi:hypothetical protein